MDQSEFEAITCSRRQARESVDELVTIGFGLSDLVAKMAHNQSERREVKPKQTRTTVLSTLVKTNVLVIIPCHRKKK